MKKITILFLSVVFNSAIAQNYTFNFNTSGSRVCLVEAEADLTIPSVTVKLLDAPSNTTKSTSIYRRPLYANGTAWVQVASALPAGTTQWTDLNVNSGEIWEYKIKRAASWTYNSQAYDATGYTIGALLKDNSNYQGQMILLVADNIATGISAKYTRLKKELTGEGWFVNEISVPKASGWDNGNAVVGIRSQVAAVYNNAPLNDKPKLLFILGHVPMPRSGSTTVTSPDGHDQNKGARGCDGYYADVDGIYTDTATYNPGGQQTPLAINLPGDFKWDQDFFPSALEMAFGRVDFEDLTNTTLSEIQLTESYLDRLSNYKTVAAGSDMGNKTGFYVGYDNSNDGSYRTLPNLSKSANVFQNTVGTPHPQWVQNNGPFKVYMQNAGFPELSEWTTYGMNATVFSSDQSYWGFNDEPQDFYYSRIRGLLALNTKCLVTLWSTSAINMFYQSCSGDALGYGVKEVMNHNAINNNLEKPQQNWDDANWWNRTHLSYNGDPTLRLFQLAPPSNFAINNNSNNAVLSWDASPDAQVTGYHIYKSSTEFGIYNRVTTSLLSATSYTDNAYQQNDWYMVRAVKPEESGCGKFLNPSIGIFVKGNLILSAPEKQSGPALSVFPNPATHKLSVTSSSSIGSLCLLNTSGKEVMRVNDLKENTITLDVSALSAGIYLLKLTHNGIIETKKIIIE